MAEVYRDRRDAGDVLGTEVRRELGSADAVVFALPRGGVPVGLGVARALDAPLDVCVVRRIGQPGHPELAIGAIAPGGIEILNEPVVNDLGLTPIEIAAIADCEMAELQRGEAVYRRNHPPRDMRGRIAVLVDDGLATGIPMRAAIAAMRDLGPRRIVVATPIAAPEACDFLAKETGTVICPWRPEPFESVGKWYHDFRQTTDRQVCECLTLAAQDQEALHSPLSY